MRLLLALYCPPCSLLGHTTPFPPRAVLHRQCMQPSCMPGSLPACCCLPSVAGRILNSVYRGYAVGVAGTVAFLPARQCSRPTSRRLGQLQKFRILEVERASARIILADPNLHYNSAGSQVFRPGSAVKRPPRNLEESQRRLELAKVAEELRSVLALRSSAASSSGGSSPAAARTSRPQQQAAEPPQRKKG